MSICPLKIDAAYVIIKDKIILPINKAEINQFELILGCSVKCINKIFLKLIVFFTT